MRLPTAPPEFACPMFAVSPTVRCALLAALLAIPACHRAPRSQSAKKTSSPTPAASAPAADAKSALPDFAVDAVASHEGEAFWYDVPAQSLPQRRAWTGELTAASDSLPLNSYARVHRLDGEQGGQDVIVRITDKGIHHRGGIIDVDRDAAQALGILKSGQARVRVETLALKNATTDKPVEKKDEPVAPKASELNGKPAAGPQAEKDAANAKTGGHSAP